MKKIFISILSVAMFAACAKTETEDIVPVAPEPEEEAQSVYVEIAATAGSETKATYDADLHAYWEAGDRILAVQGLAVTNNYTITTKENTVQANNLGLKSGADTASALFSGDISTQTSDAEYFHFAYPASAVSLSTHGKKKGSSLDVVQNTSTCTYTVPAEQDGIWTPFLCASTAEKTTAANITSIDFGTSRNACFGVRVFENGRTTPKKIKHIIISAENNIVGTISATTDNDGSFAAKEFGISGGGNTITADNLQNIEMLGNMYEYRFEVLPTNAGVLTLTISDEAGSQITRKTSAKTFRANARAGVNVYWDAAGISMDATTWFEDSCAKNGFSALSSATTIYCNVSLFGIGAADIQEKGVIVNGQKHTNSDASNKFSSEIAATNGNGAYTVKAYAILKSGEEFQTDEKIVYVVDEKVLPTITSHTIRSSYNSNDRVETTNDINGDIIKANIQLNDCWASKNLVESVTFHREGFISPMQVGAEFTTDALNPNAHKNCYVSVEFKNKHIINTPAYTINVTGIPYWWYNNPNGEKVQNNTVSSSSNFFIPTTTMDVNLVYNIDLVGKTVANIGTLTVGGNQIFSARPNKNTVKQSATKQISLSTQSLDFSYNDKSSSWVASTSYSMIYEVSIKYKK